jgi:hypothetical protein
MDFTGLLILGALYALLNLIGRSQQKKQRQDPLPPQPRRLPQSVGAPDPTQREGSRLELVLRELERALDNASPIELPTKSLPPQEEIEERESLEREPEVLSLETEVRREARRRVDQDDEAEQIEARRISAAAARDRALSKADHTEFDQRIRQEVADKTATAYTARQLRDAVVWREILGPPVSLREEGEK